MPTQGPNSAGSAANVTSTGNAWTSPGNVTASDNAYATRTLTNNFSLTDYIAATNFGFSIPAGSIINGILVEVEGKADVADRFVHGDMQLTKNGTTGVTPALGGGGSIPTSDTYYTYGSSSQLWSTSWTPEEINASTFGCLYAALLLGSGAVTVSVDHIRITVHYTLPSGNSAHYFQMMRNG